MSKPTLDEIEVDILKQRMDLRVPQVRMAHQRGDTAEYSDLSAQLESDARRYHQLTGKWYTYRHATRQVEEAR